MTRVRHAAVRVGGLVCAAAVMVMTLAGCTHEQEAPDDVFQAEVDEAIALAQRADASEAQLDALEQAKSQGSMTLELARQQTYAAIECMVAAGVAAKYDERTKPGGLVVPVYLAPISPDSPVGDDGVSQDERIIEECDSRESFYVNKLFLTQPSSVELAQAEIERRAPEIRACLENAGYAPSPDAAAGDLDSQALAAFRETDGSVNCVVGLGL